MAPLILTSIQGNCPRHQLDIHKFRPCRTTVGNGLHHFVSDPLGMVKVNRRTVSPRLAGMTGQGGPLPIIRRNKLGCGIYNSNENVPPIAR